MLRRISYFFSIIFFTFSLSTLSLAADDDTPLPRTSLKVCADPNYQPFSHRDLSGYENKIAQVIADHLNIPVEYTWFPQRLGFIRNTLRKELETGPGYYCDIVIGLPTGYGLTITSKPYMEATYALVIRQEGILSQINTPIEFIAYLLSHEHSARVGVTERSPGVDWLAQHGLFIPMAPYVAQSGDPDEFPSQPIFEDLQSGKIDAAIVWGPTASYFSRIADPDMPLKVVPLASYENIQFSYPISVGVRFGEGQWRDELNSILDKEKSKIDKILKDYAIPLAKEVAHLPQSTNVTDDDQEIPDLILHKQMKHWYALDELLK